MGVVGWCSKGSTTLLARRVLAVRWNATRASTLGARWIARLGLPLLAVEARAAVLEAWRERPATALPPGADDEVLVVNAAALPGPWLDAVKKYNLQLGFLAGAWQSDFKEHLAAFQKNLDDCVKLQPIYINCHSGRDYFSFEQNKQFIDATLKAAKASGIPIFHETHRSRICYSAPVTRKFLEEIPEMRLNVDLSHWCTVHESLLQDQPETVRLALSRADHIHARVGHPEGPQVNDPRAPEWGEVVKHHFAWWDEVVQNKINAGAKYLTILTEFGPPNYLPTLPYTRQPVANQWEINVYMKELLRKRYS